MSHQESLCGLCGEPMPKGEEMFQYHGYSGPCPKPPLAEQVEGTFTKYPILRYFEFSHLPEPLQAASKDFHALAWKMAMRPGNAETAAGLRKLLEAKDCAVRAALAK